MAGGEFCDAGGDYGRHDLRCVVFRPPGGYSVDLPGEPGGLAAGVDNPPLHALANSTTPNGVLVRSASSAFPTNSGNGVNYWVDVVFVRSIGAGNAADGEFGESGGWRDWGERGHGGDGDVQRGDGPSDHQCEHDHFE